MCMAFAIGVRGWFFGTVNLADGTSVGVDSRYAYLRIPVISIVGYSNDWE